jgi:hypothetical protein
MFPVQNYEPAGILEYSLLGLAIKLIKQVEVNDDSNIGSLELVMTETAR